MDKNVLTARDLADRLEYAANMQKKTERNKVFMEVTYPIANDAIRSLRELSDLLDKACSIIKEGTNPDFDELLERAKANNVIKS